MYVIVETAQLSEFDEALYHVTHGTKKSDAPAETKEADAEAAADKSLQYLIATSEQPLSAYVSGVGMCHE